MKKTITPAMVAATVLLNSMPAFAEDAFKLTSTDIIEGQQLSTKHVFNAFGCSGENISPALEWKNSPDNAKSFAITVYDPDAPTGSGWWHWVSFNIPVNIKSIKQGASSSGDMPKGAVQSRTDFGEYEYGGACPPPGQVHRYEFKVHALSVEKLKVGDDASAALVGFMLKANTIQTAKLTAVYTR